MQNNRKYHREWFGKSGRSNTSKKQGLTAGFEYAIQPDGTSLAEHQWQERRALPSHRYRFVKRSDSSSSYSSRLYQSVSDISEKAAQASKDFQEANALPDTSLHPEGAPILSQKRRIRNRHNAVFGEHLPNALNASGCAKKVFGADAAQTEERELCQEVLKNPNKENRIPNVDDMNLDDADDDNFLADIDVDQLVKERERQKEQQRQQEATRKRPSPYDQFEDETNTFDYGNGTRRDRESWGNQSGVARLSYGGQGNGFENRPDRSESFPYHGRESFGSSSFQGRQSFESSSPFHERQTYDPGRQRFGNNGTPSSFPPQNPGFVSSAALLDSDPSVPCCPGHNRPCRVLTSTTALNNGRQFYKCALPEGEQCDFFQWVDGVDGNWNSGITEVSGGYGASNGLVLDVEAENRRKFGHPTFRPGQREVIQQAMNGRDVFVLMPTGGGKSLCYQLPAWCCPGLAVVISPLLSLIQDQVQSLTKLGVDSVFLCSSQDYETEQRDITRRLNQTREHGGVKLLYITPEKLRHSGMIKKILKSLYDKGLLSRFIIDEAHCLSDWGHDFRPDYNQLGTLRREYPNVPLMALTATANEKVVEDAIRALGMKAEYRYRSSFNRQNLRYEVRKKDGKTIDSIASYIADRSQDSGVIYCLSRKDCENVAQKLQQKLHEKGCSNVGVSFYHAELDDNERSRRHHAWSMGQLSVLCATIAFGMGIDKPDVRYVIHYSMPKSITHYYQESGRAGRDGQEADCILYYAYKDKKVLEGMIRNSSSAPWSQSTRRKIDQLYTCLRYCENEFLCRRTMQLEFFGEDFDRDKCAKTCDNCRAGRVAERRDLTNEAITMLNLLEEVSKQRNGRGVTMVQLTELYRGSKSKSATRFLNISKLKGFGAGAKYTKSDVDRIAHAMVYEKILLESSEVNGGGFNSDYVKPGEKASQVQYKQIRFNVEFPRKQSKKASPASSKKKAQTNSVKKKKMKITVPARTRKTLTKSAVQAQISILGDSDTDTEQETGPRASRKQVLPQRKTQELVKRIKKLAGMWAQEEQMMGNKVFYWNIMNSEQTATIAAEVPTTVEELDGLGIMGENIIKEYGERLIKNINAYIESQNLHSYISGRPAKKLKMTEAKTTAPAKKDNDDDDEFDVDIDYSAIDF